MGNANRAWSWRHAVLKSDLPATTRHVLLTIGVFEETEGHVPSLSEMVDATSLSERAVRKHLGVAAGAGYDHGVAIQFAVDDPWALLRARVFATKGCQCHYCGAPASHVDHLTPRSRGGADELANLVPACARCNLTKARRTAVEWKA